MTGNALDPRLHIAFIGAGNMATALAGGILAGDFPPGNIHMTDISNKPLAKVEEELGVITCTDNKEAVKKADVVILAVKPQVMKGVLEPLKGHIGNNAVVISIAAGITIKQLEGWLGNDTAIIRCMPNTPALLNSGMTGLYANHKASIEHKEIASALLDATGKTCWLGSESRLDAVTAVSGSGPAYFFLVAEAIIKAAEQLGLDHETAKLLTVQTAYGAARMLQDSDDSAEVLRQKVTSPGGTTEAAVTILQQEGIMEAFEKALVAARDRSEELSKGFKS